MDASDKAFTGSIPQVYDRLLVPLIFRPYAIDLVQRIEIHRPRDVLEIAAGTGALTAELASHLPETTAVVATDLNEPMLAQAKARLGDKQRITWQQADAVALPFNDAQFDVVACQFGVMFFPDRIKGYSEARRVLKRDGRFFFNAWDQIEENDFADVVTLSLKEIFPNDPPLFMARTPHGYHDVERIRSDLSQAGFTDIVIEAVARTSRANSPEDAAVAYCQGSPMRGEIEARGGPGLEAATRHAAEALARRFGNGPIEGRIRAYVASARR